MNLESEVSRLRTEMEKLRMELDAREKAIGDLKQENQKLKTESPAVSAEDAVELSPLKVDIAPAKEVKHEGYIVSPFFESKDGSSKTFEFPSPPPPPKSAPSPKHVSLATPPREIRQSGSFRMSMVVPPPPPIRVSSANSSAQTSPDNTYEADQHAAAPKIGSNKNLDSLRQDVLGVMQNAFGTAENKYINDPLLRLDEKIQAVPPAETEESIPSPPKERLPPPSKIVTNLKSNNDNINNGDDPRSPNSAVSPRTKPSPPPPLITGKSLKDQTPKSSTESLNQQNAKSASALVEDRINLLGAEIDSVRIDVPYSTVQLNDKGKEVTSFVISVHLKRPNNVINLWRLQKRYSDFLALNEILQSQLPPGTLHSLGNLPKSVFQKSNGMSPTKTDKRRITLKNYLYGLLRCTADPSIQVNNPMAPLAILTVLKFLCTDILEPSSKKLFNSVMEGYLTKKGRRLGGWKRRYFVLIHDQLVYWDSKEYASACLTAMREMNIQQDGQTIRWHPTMGPIGAIELLGSKISKQKAFNGPEEETASEYRHALMISEATGNLKRSVLCAESDIERDEWVYYLVKQAEKLRNGELNRQIHVFKPDPEEAREEKTLMVVQARKAAAEAQESTYKKQVNDKRSSKFVSWALGMKTAQDKRESTDSARAPLSPLASPMGEQSHKVFGVPLARAVLISKAKDNYELPSVVYRCIEFMEAKNALQELGIYRLNGSHAVIDSIRERFDREGDVDLLKEHPHLDVHAVAGLLKRYLRELPESIFTHELHRQFLHVTDLLDRSDRIIELARLVSLLPLTNYTLLRTLMSHFIRIVRHSDENKMNARNIGIVFAPTLHAPAGIFTLLMSEFEFIFWVHNNASENSTNTSNDEKSTDVEPAEQLAPRSSSMPAESATSSAPEINKVAASEMTKAEKRRSWRADEFDVEGRNPRNSQLFEKNAPETVRFYETWITAEDLEEVYDDEEDEGKGPAGNYPAIDLSIPDISLSGTTDDLKHNGVGGGQTQQENEKGLLAPPGQVDSGNAKSRASASLIFESYVDLSSRPNSFVIEQPAQSEDIDYIESGSDYDDDDEEEGTESDADTK